MNINKLIEIAKLLDCEQDDSKPDLAEKYNIDSYVIVRSRDAGVHFGVLVDYNAATREAVLNNSRRMWRWWSASENSLSGVARRGINPSKSKICGAIPGNTIISGYCEIIPTSKPESILNAEVYNEQS